MSSTAPKKRKQAPEAQVQPKTKKAKSVKFSDKPISVTLKTSDASQNGPILARTPGVEPPPDLSFAVYEKQRRKRRKLVLHSSNHPRLDFTASSVSRKAIHSKESQYLGVFDPETNDLQLFPAEAVTMKVALKKTFAQDKKDEADEDSEEGVMKSYNERRTELGEAFGTKRAKKALKSAAANAVGGASRGRNAVHMPVTALNEAVVQATRDADADLDEMSKDDQKALINEAHPRPTPNEDAEIPADIYRLDTMIPWKELQIVDVSGWRSAVAGGASIKTTSRFVSNRVVKIVEQKDKVKTRALKYLLALITWINALIPKGKDGSRALPPKDKMAVTMPDIDETTRDSIRRRFTPKSGPRLSPWDVNRARLYACAMAITLDDCVTHVRDLQEDLGLTPKEIKNYYQQLGCTVDTSKEDHERQVAKLKVPFSLPEVRQRRIVRR